MCIFLISFGGRGGEGGLDWPVKKERGKKGGGEGGGVSPCRLQPFDSPLPKIIYTNHYTDFKTSTILVYQILNGKGSSNWL